MIWVPDDIKKLLRDYQEQEYYVGWYGSKIQEATYASEYTYKKTRDEHIALRNEVQEKLYEAISTAIQDSYNKGVASLGDY